MVEKPFHSTVAERYFTPIWVTALIILALTKSWQECSHLFTMYSFSNSETSTQSKVDELCRIYKTIGYEHQTYSQMHLYNRTKHKLGEYNIAIITFHSQIKLVHI